MNQYCHKLLVVVIGLIGSCSLLVAEESQVNYPDNYREWTHVKSMVIQKGHPLHSAFGGIHHLYANKKAMKGYENGRFPNGAVIVFDLLEADAANNAITEGSRKVVGVMQKNDRRFADTGGWGFEAFAAGNPEKPVIREKAKSECFMCHTSEKDRDFVFSQWRE